MPLTLVLFDVDGTLVDSQAHIMLAMQVAFADQGLDCPPRDAVLSIVGLSLAEAFRVLAPDQGEDRVQKLVEGYKDAFADARMKNAAALSPLYPGARDCIDALARRDDYIFGISTGKSRRGLDHVLALHGLENTFVTQQVADFHPSKPHPSMAQTAMTETGADRGVMIGDTTYDMEMGRAAGLKTIGVDWGYHRAADLRPMADKVITSFADLPRALTRIWGN